MNRAFLSGLKSVLLASLALAMFNVAAHATEEAKMAKADAAKGEALYNSGDAGRNIPACSSCHGNAGNSTISANPKLASQHEAYLAKQLHNFQTPERNQPVMSLYAKALKDDEIANLAAYLSAQVPKPGAAKDKEIVALGKKIWRAGIAEKNVPACAGCHSPNGAGIPAQFPRLAGQHQDYTVAQLSGFRSKARKNSPQMNTISRDLSDEEIKAVADYAAGLK
jgi:cytochrome c553